MTKNYAGRLNKKARNAILSLVATGGVLASTTSLAMALVAPADTAPVAVTDPAITNGNAGGGLFEKYLIPISNFLAAAVGLVVVISIIYGAIEYSSAGGDPNKVAKARGRIQKAIISLIVFLFLYAILQWIVPGGIGN